MSQVEYDMKNIHQAEWKVIVTSIEAFCAVAVEKAAEKDVGIHWAVCAGQDVEIVAIKSLCRVWF